MIKGCRIPVRARGMCNTHYMQEWRRTHPEHRAVAIAYTREWMAKHPEATQIFRVRRHGLTQVQFDALMLAQCGKCAICTEPLEHPCAIDHDHVTGEVRGLLCNHCNHVLGHAHDRPAVLLAAAEYLGRS